MAIAGLLATLHAVATAAPQGQTDTPTTIPSAPAATAVTPAAPTTNAAAPAALVAAPAPSAPSAQAAGASPASVAASSAASPAAPLPATPAAGAAIAQDPATPAPTASAAAGAGAPEAPAGPASPALSGPTPAPMGATPAAAAAAPQAPTASAPPALSGAAPAPMGATPAAAAADAATPAADTAPSDEADAASDEDLWSRIRRGFKMPDLDTKRTQMTTRWYASQPDYMERMAGRATMYLYHIVEEVEKRGLPTELALLPFVESAMQPEAVSWAKAAGLWQFIPSTGRVYSLEQNIWKDERMGIVESTRAALDYLQALYAEFGDWQLALAAYNCGEAGVERALARARARHHSLAYKDLRLPTETQFYVPKLQAIKNIVADPQRYGISLPPIRNEPYFVAFSQALDIDVTTAARLADMPLDEFRQLNPAFNRPVIVGASSPTILVPADHAETFDANLAAWQATGQPLASWTAYTLEPGETLAKVAERVGLTEAQLREANRIPSHYRPAAGSTLLVPRDESIADDIAPGYVTASFALVPDGNLRQITYRVRRGDSLATVARRWHVSADDIVSWNDLHEMTLLKGQRLTLMVPRAGAGTSHHQAAARRMSTHAQRKSERAPASPTAARSGAAGADSTRM